MYSPPPTKQTDTSLRWGVGQNTVTVCIPEWTQHDPSDRDGGIDWVTLERCEAHLRVNKLLEEELGTWPFAEDIPSRLRAAEEALAEARKRLRFIEWLASDIDAIPKDELRTRGRRQRFNGEASYTITMQGHGQRWP